MEAEAFARSGHGDVAREENSADESNNDVKNMNEEVIPKTGNGKTDKEYSEAKGYSPELKDLARKKQNDKLESARAEMSEMIEENQRLKIYLDKMTKEYQTLQMKFYDIVREESAGKSTNKEHVSDHQDNEESELVSLSLGMSNGDSKKVIEKKESSEDKLVTKKDLLTLGLDCKLEMSNASPENSSGEQKEEAAEAWPPSKVLKTMRNGDDEKVSQNQPVKKARVCVRARCDAPTMNDGCQWRKYGQKIAKGNPCPRAYYRCTVAPSCPVRKQVQRCSQDMSILITTYEGEHNHPLPMSATAMASTTSAAASMLLSGSSTSQIGLSSSNNIAPTAGMANLNGLNFYKNFYSHVPSMSPTSQSLPTITLDLTSSPSSSSSMTRLFPNFCSSSSRYPATNLNFGSGQSSTLSWGNGMFSCDTYNKNPFGNTNLGKQPMENLHHSFLQKNSSSSSHPTQSLIPDTVAKAITADPSFQSVLAATLTSIIGNGNGNGNGITLGGVESFSQKLKLAEAFAAASNNSHFQAPKVNACASSYLNKSASTSSSPGNVNFLPSSLSIASKSASASPADTRDNTN